ncbi:MAG: ribonucleoside-diphosphate reductase subunit alpha [Sulfurovum sp.]|nr:ribonucleoside-diphosphate reductase subunit alpha [Sulfurovum sp.]
MRVVKRSGRVETLDVSKIQKYTADAVKGLVRVSQSELEVDAKLQFRDMITSEEIQTTLIKTAVDKIDIDRPDWTFVASRLFLYDIYHKATGFTGYQHLRDYFIRGEKEGRIVLGLKDKYDLDELNDYLKPERDLQFTYLGIRTLYDRYLLKDGNGSPIELPQQLFMGVAMFLAQNEFDCQTWAKKFYDILSKFEVMAATPTLSNARTPRHQLSSCFTKGTEVRTIEGYKAIDKIELGDMVLTHKNRFMKVYELFERDYARNLISLDINGLIKSLDATEEHPVLALKKEDIKCIRKLGNCILNQGQSKRCFSLKGEYKKDCELLDKDFSSTWHKMEDLDKGDFVSVSYPQYEGKDTIYISDYVQTKNLIEVDGKMMFKRTSKSFYAVERSFLSNQIQSVRNKIKLSKDFMLLMGYFLAEGHISKEKNSITFTFGSKEVSYIEETRQILEDIFDVKVCVNVNKDNSTNVIVHSKIIALFFYKLVGTGFDKKILNNDILFANPKVQKWLLVAAIRGDGCALKEGYQLTMSNQKLIQQLFEIALRCGLSPYMKEDAQKHKFATIKASHLKIGVREDKSFVIDVNKNLKNIHLDINLNVKSTLRYFWFKNEYFMKIIDKTESYIEEKVYNIEVEDDHSYSVAGVNVHNCYIGSTPDNIEGIFDAFKEMALLSKFGGGIGWDWSLVRGMGSYIDGHKHAAGGIVPFLKIVNDVAIAVDQLGTRKGAIAVYIEPWHMDIRDFLDLKKNSGEERRRAHDLFPALWLNDIFMDRVQKDEMWTLFDPFEVPELTTLYGEAFEARYEELENSDDEITRETVSAKKLWKEMLRSYFETGNPFLTFKDTANRANPNKHVGVIRSTNLCTEIFQNTSPNTYKTRFTFDDGSVEAYDENEMLTVGNGTTKPAKKITALDSLNGKQIWIVDKEKTDGDTAVCNLASVNLSKVHTREDLERVVPIAIRMLDNVIDLNFYPLAKVKKTNAKSRSIGLGVMGEAQMLAESKIKWGSAKHFEKIDEVMESFSYYTIEASSNLALEKGKYPTFEGSDWSQGIFPIDKANAEACKLVDRGGLFGYSHDWLGLKEKVKSDGMRNGYLMAIAPTSSISILTGTTQAIEPVYKRKWFEENLSGLIPVVAPNLSADTWEYYTPAYDLDQNILIKAGAIRQKWLDQGQSLNIFITLDKASGKYLNEIYMNAWKFGLKSTYYLRSQSPESSGDVEDRSQECVGCQ